MLLKAIQKDVECERQKNLSDVVDPTTADWAEVARLYSDGIAVAVASNLLIRDDDLKGYINRCHRALLRSTTPKKEAGGQSQDEDRIRQFETMITAGSSTRMAWDDIKGNDRAKSALRDAVELPGLFPQLFTGDNAPPRAILMYGPPGTGKTLLARVAANTIDAQFLPITPSNVKGGYVGDSERNVRAMFAAARRRARQTSKPVIMFIDEIDGIAPDRSGPSSSSADVGMVNQMLTEMDGFSSDRRDQVYVLAATNFKDSIDSAVLSRFKQKIMINLPDQTSIEGILRGQLKTIPNEINFADLAANCYLQSFSGRDVETLAANLRINAAKKLLDDEYVCVKAALDQRGETIVVSGASGTELFSWQCASSAEAEAIIKLRGEDATYFYCMRADEAPTDVESFKGREVAQLAAVVVLEPCVTHVQALTEFRNIAAAKK